MTLLAPDDAARLWQLHWRARRALRPPPPHRRRPRSAPPHATRAGHIPLTYTSDPADIDVAELADLVRRCATFAPGQALDAAPGAPADADTDDAECAAGFPAPSAPLPARLRRALRLSMECVAAFAPDHALPPHRRLAARGLAPPPPPPPWWGGLPGADALRPRALVGFARAVGDAALVATLHDVVVLPELRGRGVGAELVARLTRQVRRRGGGGCCCCCCCCRARPRAGLARVPPLRWGSALCYGSALVCISMGAQGSQIELVLGPFGGLLWWCESLWAPDE